MKTEVTTAPARETIEAAYLVLLGRMPESEAIISLYQQNSAIDLLNTITRSKEYQDRNSRNPLYHYNSPFDCEKIILDHARGDLVAAPGLCTNFLGTKIDPKYLPHILGSMVGQIEGVPIPGNWHADIAEWAAALRAVDLAKSTFRMLELGCGWGCWMVNTGVAARNAGLKVHLTGVEADEGHIQFAREACALNGFMSDEFELRRGIVSARPGTALFPRQERPGEHWGNEPIFDATDEQVSALQATGHFDCLTNISLKEIIGESGYLDLVHIDIQGGEADFVSSCLDELTEKVAYLVIGTHSRSIEGRLFDTFLHSEWQIEIERPAILNVNENPFPQIDGLQGWRNKKDVRRT